MSHAPLTTETIERARGADILDAAQRLGAALKRQGREWIGHCPRGCTSHGDGFAVHPGKGIFLCRPSGASGDAIKLAEHVLGCDFKAAVLFLAGDCPPPARPAAPAPGEGEGADAEERYRRKQIGIARAIFERGLPVAGTPAAAYLAGRGIDILPDGAPLRFAPAQAYWRPQDFNTDDARPVHTGPAMLAAVTDDKGALTGCHITWIDAERPGEKAKILDPDTGAALPAKKLRGSKRKAAIRLADPPGAARLVIGEGIETVLSVWLAEQRADTAYWSAIDLGHLGGKASPAGKHLPEPQPERDLDPPETAAEIVLLGDGDSERAATELALRRACARFCPAPLAGSALLEGRGGPPQRVCKIAWAPEGMDFNDLLRGERP